MSAITRRGALVGVSAAGVASCATGAAPQAGTHSDTDANQDSGYANLGLYSNTLAEVMDYAAFGKLIAKLIHRQKSRSGANSTIFDISIFSPGLLPENATDDGSPMVGCCLVPVAVKAGQQAVLQGKTPEAKLRELLDEIGFPADLEPFGCVKC